MSKGLRVVKMVFAKAFAAPGWTLYLQPMSHKSARIAGLIEKFQGQTYSPHYLGFFECFNRQEFYESHDVLEALWLAERGRPNADFYKGLIQLAGAFVHLQKNRLRPAAALFKLARAHLEKYPATHLDLEVAEITALISGWLQRIEEGDFAVNPLTPATVPRLVLRGEGGPLKTLKSAKTGRE